MSLAFEGLMAGHYHVKVYVLVARASDDTSVSPPQNRTSRTPASHRECSPRQSTLPRPQPRPLPLPPQPSQQPRPKPRIEPRPHSHRMAHTALLLLAAIAAACLGDDVPREAQSNSLSENIDPELLSLLAEGGDLNIDMATREGRTLLAKLHQALLKKEAMKRPVVMTPEERKKEIEERTDKFKEMLKAKIQRRKDGKPKTVIKFAQNPFQSPVVTGKAVENDAMDKVVGDRIKDDAENKDSSDKASQTSGGMEDESTDKAEKSPSEDGAAEKDAEDKDPAILDAAASSDNKEMTAESTAAPYQDSSTPIPTAPGQVPSPPLEDVPATPSVDELTNPTTRPHTSTPTMAAAPATPVAPAAPAAPAPYATQTPARPSPNPRPVEFTFHSPHIEIHHEASPTLTPAVVPTSSAAGLGAVHSSAASALQYDVRQGASPSPGVVHILAQPSAAPAASPVGARFAAQLNDGLQLVGSATDYNRPLAWQPFSPEGAVGAVEAWAAREAALAKQRAAEEAVAAQIRAANLMAAQQRVALEEAAHQHRAIQEALEAQRREEDNIAAQERANREEAAAQQRAAEQRAVQDRILHEAIAALKARQQVEAQERAAELQTAQQQADQQAREERQRVAHEADLASQRTALMREEQQRAAREELANQQWAAQRVAYQEAIAQQQRTAQEAIVAQQIALQLLTEPNQATDTSPVTVDYGGRVSPPPTHSPLVGQPNPALTAPRIVDDLPDGDLERERQEEFNKWKAGLKKNRHRPAHPATYLSPMTDGMLPPTPYVVPGTAVPTLSEFDQMMAEARRVRRDTAFTSSTSPRAVDSDPYLTTSTTPSPSRYYQKGDDSRVKPKQVLPAPGTLTVPSKYKPVAAAWPFQNATNEEDIPVPAAAKLGTPPVTPVRTLASGARTPSRVYRPTVPMPAEPKSEDESQSTPEPLPTPEPETKGPGMSRKRRRVAEAGGLGESAERLREAQSALFGG